VRNTGVVASVSSENSGLLGRSHLNLMEPRPPAPTVRTGVGGSTLPVDVEPYGPATASMRPPSVCYGAPWIAWGRALPIAWWAMASTPRPFLHTTDAVGLPVVARLKGEPPLLAAAVRARLTAIASSRVSGSEDRVRSDYDHFDSWETLDCRKSASCATANTTRWQRHPAE